MEKVLLVPGYFLAWKVIAYQFHPQVPSKGRLLAIETTLHFQRPCICEHQGGGTEKWEKARVSTCPGPYDTHWVLIASHLHDMWEDYSIFNGWAEKCLSDLINLTRQREPLWKDTICNGLQIGGTWARNALYQMHFQQKRETCVQVTGEPHIEWMRALRSSLPPKKSLTTMDILTFLALFKEFILVVKLWKKIYKLFFNPTVLH